MREDFVRTARAKGLSQRAALWGHVLRNAMIPVITVLGLAFAGLISGAIMTETIFAWPGVGRYEVEAAINLDYPAIMGTTLLFAVIYMIFNIFVDVSYALFDPRIRES